MLNLSQHAHTDHHPRADEAAPAPSGARAIGTPSARRRHNLLWWLLVAVAIIL
jgi:hypothetical protein